MDYIDPAIVLGKSKTPWMDLYRGNNIYERTANLIDSVLILPNAEIQKKILISYLWSNAKFCELAPILVCTGKPGTGKSTIGEVACWLHNVLALGDDSSPKGLRNVINKMKYLSEEKIRERDGALLFLDNCWNRTFKEDKSLYSLCLKYKKSQDMIVLADKDGEIISFRTFSHKIVSTVDLFHADPDLTEIARRSLPIFHERVEGLEESERKLAKVSKINFQGFHEEYLKFWRDKDCVETYAVNLGKLEKPKLFKSTQWELMEEVTATGLTIGAFDSVDDALRAWLHYWIFVEGRCSIKSQLIMMIEQDFLPSLANDSVKTNLLNRWIQSKLDDKILIQRPRPAELKSTMNSLGWTLIKDKWKKL